MLSLTPTVSSRSWTRRLGQLVRVSAVAYALVGSAAVSDAQVCSASLHPPELYAQRGNACGPTAAAMALGALGESLEPDDVARRLPMSRDGVDLFALQQGIEGLGWETVGGSASLGEIAEFLDNGWPVLAAVSRGARKHLVLITDVSGEGESCDEAPTVTYVDPQRGVVRERTLEEFVAERHDGEQTIVIGPIDGPRAGASDELLAADARFRARSWALRAAAHEEANDQMIELLRRSVVADPCWEQSREWLGRAVELTGLVTPELPECEG